MATKKSTTTKSIVESESAQERETTMEQADLLADVKGILPKPERLRIRHQNALMKLQLELMPVFEELYERDEDGEIVRNEDGDALIAEGADRVSASVALADMAAQVDEWAETVALDKDAYQEWAGGKGADTFLALLSYYRGKSGE